MNYTLGNFRFWYWKHCVFLKAYTRATLHQWHLTDPTFPVNIYRKDLCYLQIWYICKVRCRQLGCCYLKGINLIHHFIVSCNHLRPCLPPSRYKKVKSVYFTTLLKESVWLTAFICSTKKVFLRVQL